jgi:hypothetical protein
MTVSTSSPLNAVILSFIHSLIIAIEAALARR